MRALPIGVCAGALACCASACAIPSRDNPHDPALQPRAILDVHVLGGEGNVGVRTAMFVLDGSASKDPLDRGPLRYFWDLGNGVEFEDAEQLVRTLEIPEAARAQLVAGEGAAQFPVRLRVETGDGDHSSSTSATVILTNRAPVVDPGEDLFVPELQQHTVVLDVCGGNAGACPTYEPDGDPVSYVWEQLRGETVLPAAVAGTSISFIAPAQPQALLFRLTADDGLSVVRRNVRVHLSTQVWVTTSNPTRVYRVYPEFGGVRGFPADPVTTVAPEGGLAADAAGGVWTGLGVVDSVSGLQTETRVLHLVPGLDGLDDFEEWSIADVYLASSIAPLGDDACVVLRRPLDPAFSPSRFALLESGDPSPDVSTPGLAADTLLEEPKFVLPRPGVAGECWAVTGSLDGAPGGSVHRFGTSGALVPHAGRNALDLDDVTAAVLATDGGLWIAGPSAGCDGARVLHVASSGAVTERVPCFDGFDGGGARFDALAAGNGGALWAHDARSFAFLHVSASGAVSPTGAPDVSLAQSDGFQHAPSPGMVFDALENHLWLVEEFSGAMMRLDASEDGTLSGAREVTPPPSLAAGNIPVFRTVALSPLSGRIFAAALDQSGAAVSGEILHVPVHMTLVRSFSLTASVLGVTPDPLRGDVWVSDGGDGSGQAASAFPLRRVTQDLVTQASVAADGSIHGVATRSDGGTWATVQRPDGSGELWKVGRDGAVDPQQTFSYPDTLRGLAGDDSVLCTTAYASPQASGDLSGDLIRYEPGTASASVHDTDASPLYEPFGVAHGSSGCWYTFLGLTLDTGGGPNFTGFAVAHWSGTGQPTRTPATLEIGGPIDVDPLTGDAWVAARDFAVDPNIAAFTVDSGGTETFRFSLPDGDINALQVQRRCAGACTGSEPLHVWVVRGESLVRLDGTGEELGRYFLPGAADITGLAVVP